jgi:hypothetical protein
MIEIDENIPGIWFVSWKEANWMAGVWTCMPASRYQKKSFKRSTGSEDAH